MRFPPAGPADVLNYGFDFAPWLAMAPDDAIAAIAATVTSPGNGFTAASPVAAGSAATVLIGPAAAGSGLLTVTITTTQGRRKSASAWLTVIPPA